MSRGKPTIREGTSAILISTDGRLLFQLRDNVSHISDPGKLDFFGGGREGDESFLDCVVREVHEEISFYLALNNLSLRTHPNETGAAPISMKWLGS